MAVRDDLHMLSAADPHELLRALEVQSIIDCAEMAARASLYRTESRWGLYHYRVDFPEQDNAVAEAVQQLWDVLQKVDKVAKLAMYREDIPKVEARLAGYSDAEVLEAITNRREGRSPERKPLRVAEFEQLISQPSESPGDLPGEDDDFFARTAVGGDLPPELSQVERD